MGDSLEIKAADPNCKHLGSMVVGGVPFGFASCPECCGMVQLSVVINNLLDAMRSSISLESHGIGK